MPRVAAMPASTVFSVRSCRTIWPRLAPSAVRTAISRCRDVTRLNNMLATLAHAMSNTRPTAAMSARNTSLIMSKKKMRPLRSDTTLKPRSSFVAG